MTSPRRAAFLSAACAAALSLTGCLQDAICGSGSYPVIQVGGTGRQCVDKGQNPPTGFARFPSGQEPKRVDDKWDVYWRTHTVDETGHTVDVPR
jgi:hypothetical protein